MGFFTRKEALAEEVTSPENKESEKQAEATAPRAVDGSDEGSPDDKAISTELQGGVAAVEAATLIWPKTHLIAAYVIIWFIYFITSTEEVVVRSLTPFVTSSFGKHSLTATTTIMSSMIASLSKLPLAKILDTWGRPQGLGLSLFLWVIGFIMMAACKNVETYAAAQVFSLTGAQAVSYCITIFVADTSTLKNRPLMLAFATSPYIVTTWIGGPIADSVIAGPGWRWGFGIWAIVTPVVVIPLIVLFMINQRAARKAGLLDTREKKAITAKSVIDYCIEVDLVGIILLAGGMALTLLPFTLYSQQHKSWQSPMIIAMLVVGPCLLIAFVLYEKFLAPVKFIPIHLLADRTVFFGGMMFFFIFFNSSVWGSYFTSMLVVVWDQGVTKSTYISNIYRVGSCFAALFVGYFIKWIGRFKWVATIYGIPLMLLGVGLLIHFRLATQSIGFVVMTQIFIAFAGGPIVIAGEMAMMAPLSRQYIAVIIAMLDLFSGMGTAIGSTVATAVWTSNFRSNLEKYTPPGTAIDGIFGSLYTQLAYKVGNPIRTGINEAYGDTQRLMSIVSTCGVAAAWAMAWLWRDIKLKDVKQVKGTVF
ncbi:hypothetical protein jhhlp_001665 [Lomentospora prolificans]|uniref:Major facilitator superfamily (MFS) profile domain-containing protein n=1 Tax=Lomentospora prolificans TaxID=41688 RepID=A0A2N3NIV2_9PEZI|nr:hypothetical protein jhhlp_001665 [Lomentospora prolificans]